MFHHLVPRLGVPLRSFLVVAFASLAGCYQGEWRIGVESPVATTTRLVPTRDVERWELASSTVPYVVQVKGNVSPRCRNALFGTMSRTDTGRFKRIGAGWWTALAIATGIAGGAAGGFGAAGWFSNLYPEFGRPVLYGGGGALVAGGLVSCIASLVGPSKARLAFCGMLVGLGGSVLVGTAVSTLPAAGGTVVTGSAVQTMPLIDVTTFRTLALAGGGLVGAAIVSGLVSASWRDYVDRERTVESEIAQSWDQQTSEQPCSGTHPMAGRTAALEITSEMLVDGIGSDVSPLKVRVALTGQQYQGVDLRGLRQALPSCGALRVQLAPDVMYENYVDEYTPPMAPDQVNPNLRPIHGIISPPEGIWLAAPTALPKGERRRAVGRLPIPGISPDVLASMERRCRGSEPEADADPAAPVAAVSDERPPPSPLPAKPSRAKPPIASAPVAVQSPPASPVQTDAVQVPPPAAAPEDANPLTPATTTGRRPVSRGTSDDGECSSDAEQSRYADCEHQCGRALELSSCLFTFRKCHIEARAAAQPQKEREACDLAWEQCLFTANVAPGSWRRCVDGCALANQPHACQNKN